MGTLPGFPYNAPRTVRLSDLIGQDAARTALLRAVERGHLAHAYLFEGAPGIGKRGAAYGLAMALNCGVSPGTGCGTCEDCRRIEAGIHPDVPTFGPSGAGGQVVIEDAKAVLALARTRPHEAAARVIVIEDADAMNPNAANCLLKTLEEPLARNHIVLVTSAPDRLLPTIRSRTQRIRFRPLSAAALLALAKQRGVADEHATVAVALADGSAARLFELAEPEDTPEGDRAGGVRQQLVALRKAVMAPGAGQVFDLAAALAADKAGKQDLPRLLALLGRLYRDALAVAAGAPELALIGSGDETGAGLAALGVDRLGRALAAITDAQVALTSNVNPALAIERLLFALKRQERRAA
jgi:DNA polymerase III subunit delta'